MARYLIVAMNGPTAGDKDEEAFNRWYDEVHVPELLTVPGMVSARRFKTIKSNTAWPYAATYEIETDDFAAAMAAMQNAMSPFPDFFDKAHSGNIVAVQIAV